MSRKSKKSKSVLTKKEKKGLLKFVALLFFWPFYLAWVFVKALFSALKSRPKTNRNKANRTTFASAPSFNGESLEFEVRGLDYRLEDFLTLAQENKRYKLPDDEFLQKWTGRKVYRYWFNNINTVELVPEPDNRVDPNAIKVVLEGVHVGYVPRELCLAVAEKLQQGYMPKVKVRGGPYKYVSDGRVNQSRAEYEIIVSLSNA